jgi:gluconolactonase
LTVVADDFSKPNGLAFSPDESILYVADSGFSHDSSVPRHIRRFAVGDGGRLRGGESFCRVTEGVPDGFRVDIQGNVWSSAGPAVECFSPGGNLLGRIRFPNTVSNLCFGGPRRNRLFVTCSHEVFALFVATTA